MPDARRGSGVKNDFGVRLGHPKPGVQLAVCKRCGSEVRLVSNNRQFLFYDLNSKSTNGWVFDCPRCKLRTTRVIGPFGRPYDFTNEEASSCYSRCKSRGYTLKLRRAEQTIPKLQHDFRLGEKEAEYLFLLAQSNSRRKESSGLKI